MPLSLVIPVFNEEGNLRPLRSAIGQALDPLSLGNRPLLLLSVLLVILGVQLVILGLLGELVVRIYYESQDKPIYTIRHVFHGPGGE